MNLEKHLVDSTITYYDNVADDLISSYETANMSNLHAFLLSNLPPESKVLDIEG